MSTFRTSVLGLAAGAAALAFAGPALAVDEITFGTNWVAEAEHGGFYQAAADGTYEKYGLKVTIIAEGRAGHAARPERSSSTCRATCSARSPRSSRTCP